MECIGNPRSDVDPVRRLIHLGLKVTETTLDRTLDVVRLVDTLLVATAVPTVREPAQDEPVWPEEEQADLDALSATLRARKTPRDQPETKARGAAPVKKSAVKKSAAAPVKKSAVKKSAAAPVKKPAAKKSAATPVKKSAAKKSPSPSRSGAAPAKKTPAKKAAATRAPARTGQKPTTEAQAPSLVVLPDA